MPSCNFVKIFVVNTEDGQSEVRERCGNSFNPREIEFRHAEYREQNSDCFLCESHFFECFNDIKDEEDRALRDWQNAKYRYYRDYNIARKNSEYFDEQNYREHNYPNVQKTYDRWQDVRKRVCRYEACTKNLKEVRRVFVVRVYTPTGREWANYYFCCKDHWERIKYRIGFERPSVEKKKVKNITLDEYS